MCFRYRRWGCIILLLSFFSSIVQADVSLLFYETVRSTTKWSHFGHVAIHLSNVCVDSGNSLRNCQPSEMGVVLSSYRKFGARENYEWMALPLWPCLYGVEDEARVPLYVDEKVRALLVETYRQKHLGELIPTPADGQSPPGDWSSMLGAVLSRSVYSFTVKTTPAQDAALIEEFNRAPNVGRFSLLTNNCTHFVAKVLNQYFPGAVRKNLFGDIGATTPKAAAKSFTHYAASRPELFLGVTKYAQVTGPIRRSMGARYVTEDLLFSPKYSLPLVWFKMPLAVGLLSSYLIAGRFDPGLELSDVN